MGVVLLGKVKLQGNKSEESCGKACIGDSCERFWLLCSRSGPSNTGRSTRMNNDWRMPRPAKRGLAAHRSPGSWRTLPGDGRFSCDAAVGALNVLCVCSRL